MYFAMAPPIADALHSVLDVGDVGYPTWSAQGRSPMVDVFVERMAARYGWTVPADEVVEFSEVVQGIELVLYLATQPGDGIAMLTPIYPPFLNCGSFAGRRVVEVAARPDPRGWAWDHEELAATLARERPKVLLLCHPHNPTGRVYRRDELESFAALAEAHDLLIISDEIHADLLYAPETHIPIASLSPATAARTVTINSASKAFNLAGLRWAVAHVGPPALRGTIADLPHHLLGVPNLAGVTAAHAAWTLGDDWLAAVVDHLDRQRHRLADLLAEHLPGVGYHLPEATYLAWLDLSGVELRTAAPDDEPYDVFARAGIELSRGANFGEVGRSFVRLNLATSGAILEEIVVRMAACCC
jgi:cysteine-S-conjugate beta-lyase